MDFLTKLLDNAEVALAGLFGALAALKFQDELSTVKGRLIFVGTGVVCAYWVTPLAINVYTIDPGLAGGVGFLLGAFGGSLLSAGFRAIRNLDLVSLLKAKNGNIEGGE